MVVLFLGVGVWVICFPIQKVWLRCISLCSQLFLTHLCVAVAHRFGQLPLFNKVLAEYATVFKNDGTCTLAQRIHQNVIKTGAPLSPLAWHANLWKPGDTF